MATLKAANVTKYDAGGSGDNCIADGLIKSVEKVWIDSYTLAAAGALGSDDSICLGLVPKGKKITEVVVYLPILNPSATTCTVFICTAATFLMTSANCYLGALQADGVAGGTAVVSTAAKQTLRMTGDKLMSEPNKDVYLYAKVVMTGGGDSISTAATIRSIIKYT
jgi:hypothetical protein